MQTNNEIKNREFAVAYNNLPELSRRAMREIVMRLSDSPTFSETTIDDIRIALRVDRPSMGGIIARLNSDNLITLEDWDGNDVWQRFIHVTAYADFDDLEILHRVVGEAK